MDVKLNRAWVSLRLGWQFTNLLDGAVQDVNITHTDNLTNGDGIHLATHPWRQDRVVAAGANDDIDLSGLLYDAFGQNLPFAKIKGIFVRNNNVTPGDIITVGGHGTAALVNWVAAANDKVRIYPGGFMLFWNPAAAGYAVTPASADMLRVAEVGGVNPVKYTIAFLGVV